MEGGKIVRQLRVFIALAEDPLQAVQDPLWLQFPRTWCALCPPREPALMCANPRADPDTDTQFKKEEVMFSRRFATGRKKYTKHE